MSNANGNGKQQNTIKANWLIKSVDVRVIDGDGANLGVMKTVDAIARAKADGVDLIEINGKSSPPVAKLMEIGKFKYDEKKKAADLKRNSVVSETKEIQIRAVIGSHDLDTKLKTAIEFLDDGHKVKWSLKLRGRECAHSELGFEKLKEVFGLLGEKVVMLNEPRAEAKTITMVVGKEK